MSVIFDLVLIEIDILFFLDFNDRGIFSPPNGLHSAEKKHVGIALNIWNIKQCIENKAMYKMFFLIDKYFISM